MVNRILYVFVACSLGFSTIATPIDLKEMTMSIGGKASMPMSFDRHEHFSLGIELSPRYALFLVDNLEFSTELSARTNLVISKQKNLVAPQFLWGISSEIAYYFPTGSKISPYLGGGLGFKIADWNLMTLNPMWVVPMGFLISLDQNLAIDIGFTAKGFVTFRSLAERIEFTPGLVGFRYFF